MFAKIFLNKKKCEIIPNSIKISIVMIKSEGMKSIVMKTCALINKFRRSQIVTEKPNEINEKPLFPLP